MHPKCWMRCNQYFWAFFSRDTAGMHDLHTSNYKCTNFTFANWTCTLVHTALIQLHIALHNCNCTSSCTLYKQCDIWCVCWFRKGLLPSPPPTHQIMWLQFMNQRLLPPTTITDAIIAADYLYIAVPRAVNGQTIGPRTTRGLRPLESDIAAILPITRGSIRGIWS